MSVNLCIVFVLGIALGMVVLGGIRRAGVARERLQACIDNGKIRYDGGVIQPSENLTDSERLKIAREIRIYLTSSRQYRDFPGPLRPKIIQSSEEINSKAAGGNSDVL